MNTANSVDVYRNLHLGQWSVRSRYRADRGRVIGRVPAIVLEDVSLVVSEAGRQRVLREKKKNVHAVVRGEMRDMPEVDLDKWQRFSYNPYKAGHFVDEAGNPLHTARRVRLDETGAWYVR